MAAPFTRSWTLTTVPSSSAAFAVTTILSGASRVVSVDLSKTYLDWANRNMELNFLEYKMHKLVQADVKKELERITSETYDIIVMDPPTFSNSKRMNDFLDVQRDHVFLINQCLRILRAGGVLFFSTNFSKFKLEENKINSSDIKDITKTTTPFDFAGKLQRQCFKITK